jgi:hypothetical protein
LLVYQNIWGRLFYKEKEFTLAHSSGDSKLRGRSGDYLLVAETQHSAEHHIASSAYVSVWPLPLFLKGHHDSIMQLTLSNPNNLSQALS